ncbi:DUF222 domain-containing protein [Microbacterium koreense]|uniref:DUF222 domain-containing protein n=1 Tax=Microbacterium koreense TaxID=323761 RepID=A0ABW2ZQQ5_9MICO
MSQTTTPAEFAAARLAPVVDELIDIRRQMAALQAREARALAQAGEIAQQWKDAAGSRSDADLAHRSVAAEIASALRVSDRTVQRQIGEAERIFDDFPATLASLEAGRISHAHVRVIADAGERITHPELRADYEAHVLAYAEAESASRLRPVARRRAQWFLNESIGERHTAAAATRGVQVYDLDDGMAALHLTGAAVIIHGIHDRLTRMARDVSDADAQAIRDARTAAEAAATSAGDCDGADSGPGGGAGAGPSAGAGSGAAAGADASADADATSDTDAGASPGADADVDAGADARSTLDNLVRARRSLDAIRADLMADLLLASDPLGHVGTTATGLGSIRAEVQVTVPVFTLIDTASDDPLEPATLAGHGPVDPDTARILTREAPGWDRILTHPVSGAVLAVDRYQPTAQMRRSLSIRDQHCRFPGCRQSTSRSDLDHTVDWDHGGKTATSNLAHLCRRHHTLKHHSPWSVRQQPGGVLEWTSPTGRRYPDHPASGVHFATDAESDPAPF